MRPRKLILLWSDDESLLSEWSFLLDIRGRYAVAQAEDGAEIEQSATRPYFAAVCIVTGSQARANRFIESVKKAADIPVLCMDFSRKEDTILSATVYITEKYPNEEILQRIKVLCARPRGPRKATIYRTLVA